MIPRVLSKTRLSSSLRSQRLYSSETSKPSNLRGSFFGFLVGFTTSGVLASMYLIDEYQKNSEALIGCVDDLVQNQKQLKAEASKISKVSDRVSELAASASSKNELNALRKELLDAIDDVRMEGLALKTDVWDLKQEMKK